MKKIEVGSFFALVDDEDFAFLSKFKWRNVKGYAQTYSLINGKRYRYMHRVIMNLDCKKTFVDHKNRNPLDNRKNNLRLCNNSENQKNKKSRGKSKYLGVSLHITRNKYVNKKGLLVVRPPKKSYLARIVVNGKQKHLGLFKSEIEAAKCYDLNAKLHHKEFANLNFN
jgi:hypothetical protein